MLEDLILETLLIIHAYMVSYHIIYTIERLTEIEIS